MKPFPQELRAQFKIFSSLRTPIAIQNFIEAIPMNFGESCRSPLLSLHHDKAHCMEGALIAAACFWYHGAEPMLLDLKTTDADDSHVVAPFRVNKLWGAISKTNHAILRYRDPVYRSVRELALSYFHEYYMDDGAKTLRSYAGPFKLLSLGDSWLTTKEHMDSISDLIDKSKHVSIVPKGLKLRRADPIERSMVRHTTWKR